MKLRNLLHRLSQLNEEELDKQAIAYNPFYKRKFPIEAITTDSSLAGEPVSAASEYLFILSPEAKNGTS